MKKGVVGGGQKVGVLSFPFFFFSFLTGPQAFLLAFFLTFVGAFFSLSMEKKKRRRRRRRKSLDAIFSYLFDTQKPTKKKIEESVVLNRPLVLGLSPCLSFFFTRFVSEKKVFTFNARNTTTTMAVTVNAIMKKSAPAPARTVKRNVRFFIIKYILLSISR